MRTLISIFVYASILQSGVMGGLVPIISAFIGLAIYEDIRTAVNLFRKVTEVLWNTITDIL